MALSSRCILTFRNYITPQHYNRMWTEWTLRVATSGPFNTLLSVYETPPWKHQNSHEWHVSLSRTRFLSPIKLSIKLLRQYVSIRFCVRHLDSGDGNSIRVWSREGGTAFTSSYTQIVPALQLVRKEHRSGTHRGFQNACPKFLYTIIAAYPTSCLAHRNFLSIIPAMIRAKNVNRDVPPFDKKVPSFADTFSAP